MSVGGAVLVVHIAAGFVGLVLGPIAMIAAKRPGAHTRSGEAYHWVVLVTAASAAVLAVLDWTRNWWFLPIAAGSYAFVLVVNWAALTGIAGRSTLWPWLLPTLLGTPMLAWLNAEIRRGRRPGSLRRPASGTGAIASR